MRLFQQTIGDFVCAKQCGGRPQVAVSNSTWLNHAAALLASVLWYGGEFRVWLPWYHILTFFCFELLLMYLMAFVWAIRRICSGPAYPRCPRCGADTNLAGRYYTDDPNHFLLSPWPPFRNYISVFAGINLFVWSVWTNPFR